MSSARKCKACGVEVFFVRNVATGRQIPLQRIRSAYTVDAIDSKNITAKRIDVGELAIYVSHFETCTDPSRFSRKSSR